MARKFHRKSYRRQNSRPLTVGICLVIAGILLAGLPLLKNAESMTIDLSPEPLEESIRPEHDYDFSLLNEDNSYYSYNDDNYTSAVGIDVSEHQGVIDWEEVKDAGIDFAFIRCGVRGYVTGTVREDNYFKQNIKGAIKAGIPVGIYFFSQAITTDEAAEEAAFTIDLIKDYDISYPVVFDMEHATSGEDDRIKDLTRDEKTEIANTYLRKIEKAGYIPMMYASSQLYDVEFNDAYLADFDLWIADYDYQPKYDYDFSIWQYTSNGSVPGINNAVDMNLYFVQSSS